jgi:intein/homing endonuclease
MRNLLFTNPDKIYCVRDIEKELDYKYKPKGVSLVLRRMHNRGKLFRSPTQLANGFYYTVKNREGLNQLYRNHILPYDLNKKEELIKKLMLEVFKPLSNDSEIDIDSIRENKFIGKYGRKYFQKQEVQEFLAMLVGFCMCDGNLSKTRDRVFFYFRFERDAPVFKMNFNRFFYHENVKVIKLKYCYGVRIYSKSLIRLLNYLGAPIGNKIQQPFAVPDWILKGNNQIKLSFLSTIIGNEGSAPSDNRWRIQFVLSKRKKYVPNLIEFQNQIRQMLYNFEFTTSHIQLRKQKGREFHARFYIKGKENLRKFYNLLEFSKLDM